MGRMYTVTTKHSSVTTAIDFQELTAHANKVLVLHSVEITQDDNETSQQTPMEIIRVGTSGSGGSALASTDVEKMDPGDTAHSFTGEKGNTTKALPATSQMPIWRNSQNAINGWNYEPTPEKRPVITGGAAIAIGPAATASPALAYTCVTVVEELG